VIEIVTLARHHDMSCAPNMCHDFRFPLHIQLHYDLEKMIGFLLRSGVYMSIINKSMTYVLFFNNHDLNLTWFTNIKMNY